MNVYFQSIESNVPLGAEMNTSDKVTKDTKILVDSIKDTLTRNLVVAAKTNAVELTEPQLAKLLSLVTISADEGYQKALSSFQNSVKKYT